MWFLVINKNESYGNGVFSQLIRIKVMGMWFLAIKKKKVMRI